MEIFYMKIIYTSTAGHAPDFVGPLKKGLRPPIALNHNRISPHGRGRRQICLDVSPNRSDDCDDRNPVKEKST
jgi:hypothetical protein